MDTVILEVDKKESLRLEMLNICAYPIYVI